MANEKRSLLFLRSQKLAVVATCGSYTKSPESALIAYCEDDELCLYFQSGKATRKVQNIKVNPHVSFVIGLDMGLVTMQYEGHAQPIFAQEALEACKALFLEKKSPTNAKYFNEDTIFYKVTPTWIGFSDYTGQALAKPDRNLSKMSLSPRKLTRSLLNAFFFGIYRQSPDVE